MAFRTQLDAAEMRRRWSDKTDAVFSRNDHRDYYVYGPEDRELEVDFGNCQSILFMEGEGLRGGEDVLLMARGSGHVTLPPGVQVRVTEGNIRLSAPAASASGAASAVGSSYSGYRAPPPTRAASSANSSASSSFYRSAAGPSQPMPAPQRSYTGSQASAGTFRPSPPNDSSGFSRAGSHVGTYVAAQRAPLPASRVGSVADWDDGASLAPSDSISSVGSKHRDSYY